MKPAIYGANLDSLRQVIQSVDNYEHHIRGAKGGIAPHHLLDPNIIKRFYSVISSGQSDAISRVILIGPDHFNCNYIPVSLCNIPWNTLFGIVEPDIKAIMILEKKGLAEINNMVFKGEHSIGAHMHFIGYFFPGSKVVPIVINNRIQLLQLYLLKKRILSILDQKTIIVLSMDFSHGFDFIETRRNDEESIKWIQNFNGQPLQGLHADCQSGAFLLCSIMKEVGMEPFVINHNDSCTISGIFENCTSYYSIVYTSENGNPAKWVASQ